MKLKLKLKRFSHTTKHVLKTHKNDILFGAGVITEVAAVIVTAKNSVKNTQEQMLLADECDKYIDDPNDDAEVLAEKDIKRHEIYRKSFRTTLKNYALPAGLTLLSVGFYGKAHINLKSELTATTAALAAEHALNQRLLKEINPDPPQPEDQETKEEATNSPYSAGIPNDLDDFIIDKGVIIYDSDLPFFAERDGYAEPCKIMLSPTCVTFRKDLYSDWTCNFDWNLNHVMSCMANLSRDISLYGFINLNEVRKHFSSGRSYKLEEAENYYIVFDENRAEDDQITYRIYGRVDENGCVIEDCLYIDIFNTVVPKPGDLKEAKRRAVAANPLKES